MTDEASAFFQDIEGQDNKNESNIGLMNQLFDGRGDKTSLAQLRQRYVPINSTSMCLGVQPQPFFKALTSIGKNHLDGQWICREVSLYDCQTIQVFLL